MANFAHHCDLKMRQFDQLLIQFMIKFHFYYLQHKWSCLVIHAMVVLVRPSLFHPANQRKKILENNFFDIDHTILFAVILTSGGACIAKNVSKPSSASKPLDSPGVTKSVDPQAEKNTTKY